MNRYAHGVVDALALVSVTILIILAALLSAGGCAARARQAPPPEPAEYEGEGCIYTLVDVRVVDLEDDLEVQP